MKRPEPIDIVKGLGRRLADLSLLLIALKYLGLIDWPWSRVLLAFWATCAWGAMMGIMDQGDDDDEEDEY